jgi:hypothetical protein
MEGNWNKLLVVGAWAALALWMIRPVPGKGLPIGRRWLRSYLKGRQAVLFGATLMGVGAVLALVYLYGTANRDLLLIGFCLLWPGLLYVYHGAKMVKDT